MKEDKDYEFIVESDKNLVARFKRKTAKIEIEMNDSTMGAVLGNGEYQLDEKVTLTAKPKENYEFVGWFNPNDKKISSQLELEIIVDSNKKILAKFKNDLNRDNISKHIKSISDYRLLEIGTRDELINLIDISIDLLDKKIIDVMVYDLIDNRNQNTFIKDYEDYMQYYFGENSHTDFNKLLYDAREKAKKDYPNKFDDKFDLYHNQKSLILDYIDNERFKKQLSKYYTHYFGLKATEGGYIREIDYAQIKEEYGEYLSDEFNKYLDLKVEEIMNRLRIEVYVILTPDELATRMIQYESFLKTADNMSLKEDIKESYMECLSVLLKPRYIISYLNEYHQATYEYRMALDRLMKNDTAEVTSLAASKMFKFVYSKEDFILRSYSDDSEIKKNYENILSDIKPLINEKYFSSN